MPVQPASPVAFQRALGLGDVALLTVGGTLGSGVFLTSSDVARATGDAWLIVLVWPLGGLLVLAGALSFAELGAMFPRAGGQYHFIREAWGELPAFLFGWACFFVIMSGGNATLAVASGEYLSAFVPELQHPLLTLPIGHSSFELRGVALVAAFAIVVLTAINVRGVREGALLQSVVTVAKMLALLALAAAGLLWSGAGAAPSSAPAPTLPPAGAGLLAGVGLAMIGVLWTYDGWYGATNVGEEIREPQRNLPRGLLLGTLGVTLLYTLVNVAYVRVLTPAEMASASRVGEVAAARLFGDTGARLVSAAVVVSCLGCLSATILYAARVYVPMARDGLFFRALGELHPRHGTPAASLWAQAAWSVLLAFSGSFEQLYTYTTFVVVGSYVAIGAALFVLRRRRPELARPYRAWGYPWLAALFVLVSAGLLLNTLVERPREALLGAGLLALGLPAYSFWRSRRASAAA
ncbi:MAG: APC family permease [Vicinamibacteria bacterium]